MKIHPTAFVAPTASVMGDVTLGEDASVWYQCVLRGDIAPIIIGARSNIQDLTMVHVDVDLPCVIGEDVVVGHRCILHGCTIENGSLIGMGAIVLNNARIGAGSVIGAGAVVTEGKVIPPGSVVLGAPAKVVKPVDETLRQRVLEGVTHYVELARRHRRGGFPLVRP